MNKKGIFSNKTDHKTWWRRFVVILKSLELLKTAKEKNQDDLF